MSDPYGQGFRAGVAAGLRHAAHRLWPEDLPGPERPSGAEADNFGDYADAWNDWCLWSIAIRLRAQAEAGGYGCLGCLMNVPLLRGGERRHTEPGPDGVTYDYPCTATPDEVAWSP